jgi:fructan beta-fructosidase
VKENRDPKVVWHARTRRWIMALYKDGNTFAFFGSPDLKTWTHLHDIDVPGCAECPDFFEMPIAGEPTESRWVFTSANGLYLIGTFDGQRFTPETGPLQVDFGANYYAVQTYSDSPPQDGRRIQIAWMAGGQYPGMPFNQQMSFPCEMTLRRFPEGLRICRTPVREIEHLHTRAHTWRDLVLQPSTNPLTASAGDLFDIRMEIEPGQATEIHLTVRGERITYHAGDRTLTCLGKSAPVAPVNDRINLQVLVDRASLEVFANEGKVGLTSCFLPAPGESALDLSAMGGAIRVNVLNVYELKSAWR